MAMSTRARKKEDKRKVEDQAQRLLHLLAGFGCSPSDILKIIVCAHKYAAERVKFLHKSGWPT